jgi:hypothetical protein
MWHSINNQILQVLPNVFLVVDVMELTSIVLVNQMRSLQFYLSYIHETVQVLGDVLMELRLHQF